MLIPIVISYLAAINLIAFVLMAVDKYRAIHRMWRISERILFAPVLVGGGIGGVLAMQLLHHKTRHASFLIGFPLIAVVEYAMMAFAYFTL